MVLTKQLQETATCTFANAFHEYPMFTWCLPDAERRWERVHVFFQMMISHGVKYGQLELTSPGCEGVVHYLPPETPLPGTWRYMRCGGLKLLHSWGQAAMKRLETITTIVDEAREHCMQLPHFYIMQIGIEPAHQGKGHGKALFNKIFAMSEEKNCPCYLETFKTVNVEIYKHLEFQLADQRPVPGSPLTLYAMIRDP